MRVPGLAPDFPLISFLPQLLCPFRAAISAFFLSAAAFSLSATGKRGAIRNAAKSSSRALRSGIGAWSVASGHQNFPLVSLLNTPTPTRHSVI